MQEMLARYTHQVITAADGRQFGVLAESAGVAPSLWQWQVTLDGSNVPSIPGGSSLYSSPTATSAATVTGYDAETGWTGPAVTADRWVCWQVTLSAAYAITDIALASRNVGADDWYDLKGVSPDYIDRMFVPIAHIVADGDGLTVRQLVWTIPTFERVVIDGYLGLWTR